jgi:Rieske Fe-S protein
MSKKRRQAAEQTPPPAPAPAEAAAPASAPAPSAPPVAAAPEAAPFARRDFLAQAGGTALALAGLGAVGVALRFSQPPGSSNAAQRFSIGVAGDFKVRSLTWLRERELFVVRDEQGFGAFSSRCTHLGCTVRRTADGFACPCHGARFGERGQVLAGPARRGLPWHPLWVEADGKIWVDLGRESAAATSPLEGAGA